MSKRRSIPESPWFRSTTDAPFLELHTGNISTNTNASSGVSASQAYTFDTLQITSPSSIYADQAPMSLSGVYNSPLSVSTSQYATSKEDSPPNYFSKSSGIWSADPIYSFAPGTYTSVGSMQPTAPQRARAVSGSQSWDDTMSTWHLSDLNLDLVDERRSSGSQKVKVKEYHQRKPSNRDEFDGPHQLLDPPSPRSVSARDRELPHLATNLFVTEQDQVLSQVNDRLSQCAFDFVARYQFPIPIEPDKRRVSTPADREWTEWVYLLKRLATKRRIPARILYNGQIKQLITILENSLEMRHAAKHQSRPLKDDRNVLQLISAGLQVAKILKDPDAMEYLDHLYNQTEGLIQMRKNNPGYIV